MGRSSPNEGTYRFKEQWGARPVPLHWQYWLAEGEALPERSPKNRRFDLCIRAWKKLPLWVAGSLGPILSKNLP